MMDECLHAQAAELQALCASYPSARVGGRPLPEHLLSAAPDELLAWWRAQPHLRQQDDDDHALGADQGPRPLAATCEVEGVRLGGQPVVLHFTLPPLYPQHVGEPAELSVECSASCSGCGSAVLAARSIRVAAAAHHHATRVRLQGGARGPEPVRPRRRAAGGRRGTGLPGARRRRSVDGGAWRGAVLPAGGHAAASGDLMGAALWQLCGAKRGLLLHASKRRHEAATNAGAGGAVAPGGGEGGGGHSSPPASR